MSTKKIRLILFLMLLNIVAAFVTQSYWFERAFTLQETQLDEKINIALRGVADRILSVNQDETTRIPPITKTASNEFYVSIDRHFTMHTLDESIREEFKRRNIDISYDYFMLSPMSEELILGNTLEDASDTAQQACMTRAHVFKDTFDFKLRINDKTAYLMNSMGIWVFSSLSLLVLLAVFVFIMVAILKGKKLSSLKKDFVNNMTHELKTPIANIAVASEAIKKKKVTMDEAKLARYADIIHKENERLHQLVDRVLQISSIEKEEESLKLEWVDFHALIPTVAKNFDPVLQPRKGAINIKLNAKKFGIQGDITHLSNIINSLIDNAIKYSKDAPFITIITENIKNGFQLSISDKGIGISKDSQSRIFEQFYRAETGDLHNTKGHGLGLSYVKLIIEKHGGSVDFKSEENVGTTFNIYLPFKS